MPSRRVPAEIAAELIDLVQQDHGIDRARPLHQLNYLPRQRADIGSPVSADLGFVMNAAKGETHKFSPRGPGYRFSKRSFTNTRCADKAKDRTLRIFYQLADSEKFQDPLFDLFQPVMVGIERFFGFDQIVDLFGTVLPGNIYEPIEVRARNGALGGHRRHRFEAGKLLQGLIAGLFAHPRFFDLLFQLVELGFIVLSPEFFVDGLDLFVQIILALVLVHLLFRSRMDRRGRAVVFLFQLRGYRQVSEAVPELKTFQEGPVFLQR